MTMLMLAETLFWLYTSHFICDFSLQTQFMAEGKSPVNGSRLGVPWYWTMLAHSWVHGGGVALATKSTFLGLLEIICHFVVDYTTCIYKAKYPHQIFYIDHDQLLHLFCKLVWIGLMIAGVR